MFTKLFEIDVERFWGFFFRLFDSMRVGLFKRYGIVMRTENYAKRALSQSLIFTLSFILIPSFLFIFSFLSLSQINFYYKHRKHKKNRSKISNTIAELFSTHRKFHSNPASFTSSSSLIKYLNKENFIITWE